MFEKKIYLQVSHFFGGGEFAFTVTCPSVTRGGVLQQEKCILSFSNQRDGIQAPKFGMAKYHENLKILVFVCCRSYLVIFGFVLLRLPEHLVFFKLLILVLKVFEKIWIWYFTLRQTQIKILWFFIENGCFSLKNGCFSLKNGCFSLKKK